MMKRNKLLSMLLALCMVLSLLPAVAAAETTQNVTLDFTSNTWNLPTDNTKETASFTDTNTGYTITLSANDGYKFIGSYLLFGKSNATLTLPEFSFDVERIVVTGRSGASSYTKMNVYVGDTAVSSETTGCTGTTHT